MNGRVVAKGRKDVENSLSAFTNIERNNLSEKYFEKAIESSYEWQTTA